MSWTSWRTFAYSLLVSQFPQKFCQLVFLLREENSAVEVMFQAGATFGLLSGLALRIAPPPGKAAAGALEHSGSNAWQKFRWQKLGWGFVFFSEKKAICNILTFFYFFEMVVSLFWISTHRTHNAALKLQFCSYMPSSVEVLASVMSDEFLGVPQSWWQGGSVALLGYSQSLMRTPGWTWIHLDTSGYTCTHVYVYIYEIISNTLLKACFTLSKFVSTYILQSELVDLASPASQHGDLTRAPRFYEQLRTREQLGYIVSCRADRNEGVFGHLTAINSNH